MLRFISQLTVFVFLTTILFALVCPAQMMSENAFSSSMNDARLCPENMASAVGHNHSQTSSDCFVLHLALLHGLTDSVFQVSGVLGTMAVVLVFAAAVLTWAIPQVQIRFVGLFHYWRRYGINIRYLHKKKILRWLYISGDHWVASLV